MTKILRTSTGSWRNWPRRKMSRHRSWCKKQTIDVKTYDTIINKTPLSYRTNRILSGVAPSDYLAKLEAGRRGDPPIDASTLDTYLTTHCIDPRLLRANDFDAFMKDRENRLLALIARTTGHKVEVSVPADEEDLPDDIARGSRVMAIAAE
jgi:hypothetical protein